MEWRSRSFFRPHCILGLPGVQELRLKLCTVLSIVKKSYKGRRWEDRAFVLGRYPLWLM